MIELQYIGTSSQLDDPFWISERRAQIHVEEFQWALSPKQTIQLFKIVRRTARQRAEDECPRFGHCLDCSCGNDDLIPSHRLNNFVGCIPRSIDSRQDCSGWKADSHSVDIFDVDSFVFRDV